MSHDLLKFADGRYRIDLDLLYPPFLGKVLDVLAECQRRGCSYFPVADLPGKPHSGGGFRSWDRQNQLYFQGRTTPGPIVTGARGGESVHNYGLGVDLCADADATRAGLQPDWDPKSYALLGEVSQAHGLVWGGAWKRPDGPHIQWPGYVTALDLRPLRDVARPLLGGDPRVQLRAAWNSLPTMGL